MRTHTTRTTTRLTLALTLTATLFAAGCGSEEAADGVGSKPSESKPSEDSSAPWDDRARQVADAWEGSKAAETWLKGYFPMSDAAPALESGFHNDADNMAHNLENYALRGELPTAAPEEGEVKWKGGKSLTLPLLDAQQTYTALDRFDDPREPQLTVTGATLGEMTIATSRGPATVPAWLFTLKGYDEPLKRVALRPSKLPKPPIEPAGDTPTELTRLPRLVEVSEDGRTVTVLAQHGSCDDGPRVDALETDGSVVLSATVAYVEYEGACTADMKSKKVKVELERPLNDRILLDAYEGRPVPYGEPGWSSPSWR